MTTILHDVRARCPAARVWALLADLEAVGRYNPTVRAASVVGGQRSGVGARRACELAPSGRVVERVTHWEEGRALGLEVAESDWPVRYMRWVTRVEPDGDGARITQELAYELKFGLLGRALDALVMRRKLKATLDSVLASLVRHAEGEP